jgi:hypothetical protein
MIPELNEHGYLPPGVHSATLQEVVERFGDGSEQREAQAQSLQWLEPLCRRAGIVRLLINGSFTSDKLEPNDVDCVLLQGAGYRTDSPEAAELRQGLPFLEIKIVDSNDYEFFSNTLFASDRDMIGKGVIEVAI